MYANAVKQVRTTLRTQVLFTTEEVVGKLGLTVSPGTEVALGDHVFPTEKEKQDALFRTERSGSSAVEVSNTPSHEEDGIVGSNDLGAFRAGPLLLLHRFDLGGRKYHAVGEESRASPAALGHSSGNSQMCPRDHTLTRGRRVLS